MVGLRLSPSDCFTFKKPDKWHSWKIIALSSIGSFLRRQQKRNKHSIVLLRKDTEEVLVSIDITPEQRKKYENVLEVRKNTIFEGARFNRRNYQEGESAEQYITVLYSLVDNCDYGDFKVYKLSETDW